MNVLLITSDQQHWDTIGKYNADVKTPNLDRLCDEGICFNRAYTVNPTCTPTRASIITGKYPSQHGAWTLGTKLPESEYTVGEAFRAAGYQTALIGKAHFQPLVSTDKYPSLESRPVMQDLDFWRNYRESFYGFGHVELARNHTNESHVGQHYAAWMEDNGLSNWRDYFLEPTGNMRPDGNRVWKIPEEFHYNNWIAKRTNACLKTYAKKKENFFLWASFFDPHPSYLVPEPWASMYDPEKIKVPQKSLDEEKRNGKLYALTQQETPDISPYQSSGYYLHGVHSQLHDEGELKKDIAVYYGMISMMDHYIGKILDQLEESNLIDDTLIVFTSDHGHFTGHHGLTAKGPFMFEDLIKVPFIVSSPGQQNKGKTCDSIQSLVDLAPTFLNMCGIAEPDGMAGINQSEVWQGSVSHIRKWAICEMHHEYQTINMRTYVNQKYKITVNFGNEDGDLYDLENDPKEIKNLWNDPDYQKLKSDLIYEFLQAEIEKEPKFMPRIADA